MERAAPPRASPSILVRTRPVTGTTARERLGHVDRFLAGHRVDDEERLGGLERRAQVGDLRHQRGIDGEAAGGVDDDGVANLLAGGFQAGFGDGEDRGAGGGAEDGHVQRLAEGLELIRGGRPVRVRGDEDRPTALLDHVAGQLGGAGRLARALQADEHDDGRIPRQMEGSIAGGQERDQLLVDDLHDLLAGGQAVEDLGAGRALAHAGHEVLDDLEVDVRLEQRQAHLAHGGIDVGLADSPAARQGTEGLAQPLAQRVEHWWSGLLIRPAGPKQLDRRWAADSGGTESSRSLAHRARGGQGRIGAPTSIRERPEEPFGVGPATPASQVAQRHPW